MFYWDRSERNKETWTKYWYWRCPQAKSHAYRTIRLYEAARIDFRYYRELDMSIQIPKMRSLPDEVAETNYGEWAYSWIKENRWNHTRQTRVETPKKHQILRKRREQRVYRAKQKRYGLE